jgi:acetolactate synthase-1/2/3 large subunit
MSEDYRVADFIADFISDELKLSHIFLVTGAGIMHLTDGIAKNRKIKAVALHHEQSCSMAADAYSKFNNDFSVSMYSTGPAATNAITGLAGAWQDSVPSLFISGQVKTSESTLAQGLTQAVRQFGVQELNVGPMVQSVSKYFVQLRDPAKIKFELQKAVHIAKSGRPGPVWLEIPMNIQAAKIDKELLEGYSPESKDGWYSGSSEMTVGEIAQLFASSKRPVILAGRGVNLSKASTVLEEFAANRSVPIVSTYLGVDGLRTTSQTYVGKVGVKGSRAGNLAIQNADFILAIGSSLHVSSTGYEYQDFAREAKLIVIDIDLESHEKSTVEVFGRVEMDAREFITQLSGSLPDRISGEVSPWLSTCLNWKFKYPVNSEEYSKGPEINIYKFVDSLSKLAPDRAIFISDAGSAYYAVSQGIELSTEAQRYITSGAMATMGFTVPAAIGASFSSNEAVPVLAVTGDGSLQQNIQELQVIAQYSLPIKLFILNNNGYLSIRASQKNYFESREIGAGPESGLTFPDVLSIAAAYGIPARRVSKLSELESAISNAISSPGPFILDVVTPPDQLIIPTVSSRIDEAGVMKSRPLEDMFPFLEREEFLSNLFVDPI